MRNVVGAATRRPVLDRLKNLLAETFVALGCATLSRRRAIPEDDGCRPRAGLKALRRNPTGRC